LLTGPFFCSSTRLPLASLFSVLSGFCACSRLTQTSEQGCFLRPCRAWVWGFHGDDCCVGKVSALCAVVAPSLSNRQQLFQVQFIAKIGILNNLKSHISLASSSHILTASAATPPDGSFNLIILRSASVQDISPLCLNPALRSVR